MDGFVVNAANTTTSDGTFVMGFYDNTDLPFYYWLATTYAVSDRHFAPMASGTFANRNFLLFGSNAGIVDTGISFPPPSTPSIFQTIMDAGFTWRAYTDGSPLSGTLDWGQDDPGVGRLKELFAALDAGTLPNVVFVDGRDNIEDDHPLADLQTGEAWVKAIYDHAVKSPQWNRMAIFWTYDEAGAFADHVVPPNACKALPSTSPFVQMGPRVPLVVISPWAKRNYASHVVHDHTAITRFIETAFDLPALSARDANSDALLDMFDFTCGRDLAVQPAPDPGTGGCPNPPPVGP
jgi:phospholipase C